MILAHKIRLNPTDEQEQYFFRCAGIARFTWNWALAEVNAGMEKGEFLSPRNKLKKEFNRLRKEDGFAPFVGEVTTWANQYAFDDLQKALTRYFKLNKEGKLKRPKGAKPRKDNKPFGWPRFKSRHKTTPAFGLANQGLRFDGHNVKIPRCPGSVNMAEKLRLDGKVMSGRITYTAGRWYLSVQVEIEHEAPAANPSIVGVDLGIKHLAITSDGQLYDNVKALKTQKRKLARLQRSLSRKQKGSKNREKAKAKVGKLHAKIANLRRDTIHKMTTDLARQYGIIGLENLNVKGMMSNHKLAQAIADASFGEIVRQLGYKAELNGGQIVLIDQWFPSSKTCSACGAVMDEMPLHVRRWTCPACGSSHDRDINAAINIRNETVKLLEAA